MLIILVMIVMIDDRSDGDHSDGNRHAGDNSGDDRHDGDRSDGNRRGDPDDNEVVMILMIVTSMVMVSRLSL